MIDRAVEEAYRAATAETLAAWSAHPDEGAAQPPAYDPHELSLVAYRCFAPTPAMLPLLAALDDAAASDPRVDLMPRAGLHVTFLGVTKNIYRGADELPPRDVLAQLATIVERRTRGIPFRLDRLRLVPLPNALLLAGVPDRASLAARAALVADLHDTPLGPRMRERYGRLPLPPLFWHSSLVRYAADRFPPRWREIYHAFAGREFGTLELGPPELRCTNHICTRELRIG